MTEWTDAAERSVGDTLVVDLVASEFEWEFAPGVRTVVWGYNQQVPGPVIEARRGETLVVRLTNHLPEPTTIHWHGLRVPAAMDGTEMTQRTVEPGATYEYRFVLPDAGTFWYHPHTNETVQLERGLYGALIVHETEDDLVFDRDRTFVMRDVKLDRRKRIAKPGSVLERHNGREGNVLLVNGRESPEFRMRAGQIERWRFVNAASARYVRLALGGREFSIVGTDGGVLERPVRATEVLLVPGDRVELAVGPFAEGDDIEIAALPYNRGVGKPRRHSLASVKVLSPCASKARVPERLRTIESLASAAAEPNRTVKLSGRMSVKRGVDFMINDEMHHHAPPVRVGELQVWDVVNVTPIDHPFHLHGFFFQVLAINDSEPAYRSWEDTINVPARGRVRIAWRPDDRPGSWMYHCHILEHHAAGMMAHFNVIPDDRG